MTTSPVRLLLVDDAEDLRFLLRMTFSRHPRIEVVGEAGDGDEALERIRALAPDLVLLDVEMPRRNGLQVLDDLQGVPDAPVIIMLSGVSTELLREGAAASGAAGFVDKAARPGLLLEQVLAIHDATLLERGGATT